MCILRKLIQYVLNRANYKNPIKRMSFSFYKGLHFINIFCVVLSQLIAIKWNIGKPHNLFFD